MESRRKTGETKTEENLKERKADATSKDTLEDLEESRKVADSSSTSRNQSIPSPDGQPADKDRESVE